MTTALPPILLLDLDDTILHFSAGRPDFWNASFSALRSPTDPTSEAFCRAVDQVTGPYWADPKRAARGRLDLWTARRDVAQLAFDALGLTDQALAQRVADAFTQAKEDAVAPFVGAIDALKGLLDRRVRLGLVTNGHPNFQRRKLERYGLAQYFEAVLIEGEWGVGKPDASIFTEALDRMGAAPTETWMIGDNPVADIAGAQAVGMQAVWVDHGGAGPPDGCHPDRVIRHLSDLL